MQLSRNVRQNGTTGVIAILTVVAHLFLYMTGEELEFADTVEFASPPVDLKDALDATGRNIVPVDIRFEMTIQSTEAVQLLGDIDFSGKPGDVLIFRKKDGRWNEVGRYLQEG